MKGRALARRTVGALLVALACWPAWAQVDLAPWLQRDRYEAIKISPDGRHYAATVAMEDRTVLVVLERASQQVVSGGMGIADSVVDDFWWADDSRIVIAMAQTFGSEDQLYATGEVHLLELEGKRVRRLLGAAGKSGIVQNALNEAQEYAAVIEPVADETGSILVSTWLPGARTKTHAERLNLRSGRRSVVAAAPLGRASFTIDPSGSVRFAEGPDDQNYRQLHYRESASAPWRLVNDQRASGFIAVALGMDGDGQTAYIRVSRSQGPDAIEAWDMRTLARTELLRDPVVDPDAILYDIDGRTPIGARYVDDGATLRFFDEQHPIARRHRMLEKALPGRGVAITSTTRDGQLALVGTWNDRDPAQFLLFDTQARTANAVFARMAWLPPERLAPTRRIALQARDGLALQGYLTRPPGAGDAPLPMVVMPHGGPFGVHDAWGFDLDAQVLAAAGYAVLRVNFRGSSNYGYLHRQLGAREWGGTMQDDLTDATRWAVNTGVADRDRICIAGASYGGYAALMGVAKEPDLYRCAVGYVGVYDLPAMHAESATSSDSGRYWANDWMGERSSLAARSPVNLAGQIKVPVFLAAGGADRVASISHSRKMQRALEAAGVPVQTLYIDSEGHGFRKEEHRRRYYAQLLGFLSEHLGGAAAH